MRVAYHEANKDPKACPITECPELLKKSKKFCGKHHRAYESVLRRTWPNGMGARVKPGAKKKPKAKAKKKSKKSKVSTGSVCRSSVWQRCFFIGSFRKRLKI